MDQIIQPELAEICGAIMGDGWIESRGHALYIAGHPTEDKDYYDFHLAPLVSKVLFKVKTKEYKYWSVYGIHIYNKN